MASVLVAPPVKHSFIRSGDGQHRPHCKIMMVGACEERYKLFIPNAQREGNVNAERSFSMQTILVEGEGDC